MSGATSGVVVLACLLCACGSTTTSSPGDGDLPADTYRLDFSQYPGGGVPFSNESLALSFDLAKRTQVVSSESPDVFDVVYNRLPCQVPNPPVTDDQLATGAFQQASVTAHDVVHLESLSLETVESPAELCYVYRTSDGNWHGKLAPQPASVEAATGAGSIQFLIDADHVDLAGVIVYTGRVRSLTYVARREAP